MLSHPSNGTDTVLPRDRLIVALDLPTVGEAHRIIDQLGNSVGFYKVGLHLQLDPRLPELFHRLKQERKQIFLDYKYIDISATVEGGIGAASNLGIRFTTVMAQRHIVEAAVKARRDSDLKILAVTLLTGTTEEDMRREYRTKLSLPEFVRSRAQEAHRLGCDGVISSPNEIQLIRSAVETRDFLVVTPGIRPSGVPQDDQRRTATPYDAISRGADYLVVGRPIIRANEPRDAARRIIEEIGAATRHAEDGPPAAMAG